MVLSDLESAIGTGDWEGVSAKPIRICRFTAPVTRQKAVTAIGNYPSPLRFTSMRFLQKFPTLDS